MSDDTITKNYFPKDQVPNDFYSSEAFVEILKTNAMTKDGLDAIATYFDLLEAWNAIETEEDFNIEHYYDLLLMVKKSKKDKIWMSFYEGLHRHAALMMCLLCSKFDLVTNEVKYGSLSADYIKKKISIKDFKTPDIRPIDRLNEIFIDETVKAPMLTTLVTIKAFVPKSGIPDIKLGDLDSLLKASRTYSENISISKRSSADKSMTIFLADTLDTIEKLSKANERNDVKHRPILNETFARQKDNISFKGHLEDMKKHDNDEYKCYKFSDKLTGKKWNYYTIDALNPAVRDEFLKTLSTKGIDGDKICPPLGLHLKNFTEDYPAETQQNKGLKYLDAGHMNAFILIPPIATILNAKLQNKPLRNMVNDDHNAKMISYLCRYQYRTKAVTMNKVHPVLMHYSASAEFKTIFFINNLLGHDRSVPVTIFLVTIYNACMLFQDNKTTNLLIPTLQRFDMIGKLSDESFIETMSENLCNTYFSNFENYAYTNVIICYFLSMTK